MQWENTALTVSPLVQHRRLCSERERGAVKYILTDNILRDIHTGSNRCQFLSLQSIHNAVFHQENITEHHTAALLKLIIPA